MTARQSIISLVLLLVAAPRAWAAGTAVADTIAPEDKDTTSRAARREEAYTRRVERYDNFWASLRPDCIRLQYAGSVGLVNAGMGWEYGRHDQWETDLMVGFVPRYEKEKAFCTLTVRETYVPWTKPLKGRFTCQPLSCGLFVNSVLRSDYWRKNPERYPSSRYYTFSTKVRFHIFVGQRYTYSIPTRRRLIAHSVSAVWELSTCDLYLISKATNKSLPWYDVLSLSLGLKYDF